MIKEISAGDFALLSRLKSAYCLEFSNFEELERCLPLQIVVSMYDKTTIHYSLIIESLLKLRKLVM